LPGAAASFVNNVIPKEYFAGSTAVPQASHAATVDGHPGWLIQFAVRYHLQGVKASQDTDVVLVVDTGKGNSPAVFVAAVPNDASHLLPDITAELQSLRIG